MKVFVRCNLIDFISRTKIPYIGFFIILILILIFYHLYLSTCIILVVVHEFILYLYYIYEVNKVIDRLTSGGNVYQSVIVG